MTLALAIGYDWLFNELSEGTRGQIRSAIVEKGVSLQFSPRENWWIKSTNNWGQVCQAGMAAGALAVLEDEPELTARTVHSALQNVTHSMEVYRPKGSYPEGPGYWSYGTSFNVVLIDLLESVLGSDFGLDKAPGFDQTGQYMSLVTGPSGLTFNYADGGAGRGPQPALFWFAARFGRPDWLFGEGELWMRELPRLNAERAASGGGRLLPLALLWMGETVPQPARISMPLHWNGGGETPITVHRSSWADPNATFLGLKGGSPSANHANMDTGSFVLDACGVRWAMDLGAENYHGIEARGMNLWDMSQDSDRWTIFRQHNEGHNTLVIDGKPQLVVGRGEVVEFSDSPERPYSIVDMSSVYEGQADSVHRGVALLESKNVLIQDELEGLEPGSRVRWGMITPATVKILNDSTVELRHQGKLLNLKILAPEGGAWVVIDIETPPQEWDSPNPGTRMMAFENTSPESGELRLAVLGVPCNPQAVSSIQLRSLADW
jgi:hypothetical protein